MAHQPSFADFPVSKINWLCRAIVNLIQVVVADEHYEDYDETHEFRHLLWWWEEHLDMDPELFLHQPRMFLEEAIHVSSLIEADMNEVVKEKFLHIVKIIRPEMQNLLDEIVRKEEQEKN
ncbi:hypothetical protein HK097_004079 [Rhizophlyctis rosea]|uniref:Uncharacterized protein n=1 Tax=Rhizophlyctis rosea TaxID=64517 RepID=A0AAD5SM71_9FUNG|nr:hypothetical protein HK097_004079 [Rhizophlyctis rosea]